MGAQQIRTVFDRRPLARGLTSFHRACRVRAARRRERHLVPLL